MHSYPKMQCNQHCSSNQSTSEWQRPWTKAVKRKGEDGDDRLDNCRDENDGNVRNKMLRVSPSSSSDLWRTERAARDEMMQDDVQGIGGLPPFSGAVGFSGPPQGTPNANITVWRSPFRSSVSMGHPSIESMGAIYGDAMH